MGCHLWHYEMLRNQVIKAAILEQGTGISHQLDYKCSLFTTPIFEFCSKTRHNIGSRTLASHVSSYQLNILDEINENFIVSGKYDD